MRGTERNYFKRILAILLITMACCLGLYWLPDEPFGIPIKKMDMLSDLRREDEALWADSTDAIRSTMPTYVLSAHNRTADLS